MRTKNAACRPARWASDMRYLLLTRAPPFIEDDVIAAPVDRAEVARFFEDITEDAADYFTA